MFGRKLGSSGNDSEPRPPGVRIMQLALEDREKIAQHRFEELAKHLKASGCAILPDHKSLAINFDTGEQLLIVQVDRDDPRRIKLMMIFTNADGNLGDARLAAEKVTLQQFAAKVSAVAYGEGFEVTVSAGVYAEALHAFGDSLKAYVDDVVEAYERWIGTMIALEDCR